jgi:voltage-gated potassium channel
MSARPALPGVFFLVLRRLRIPLIVLISAYAISITGFVLIPGTLEDGTAWRMDFFHAFYFVSYMGSTIGFGELPHPFNGAQRLWTLFSIYATVTSWLYAIGTMISLVQDRAFTRAVTHTRAINRVRRLREPFYLVCGYGEAGKVVIRFLSEIGERSVVIDRDDQAINELVLGDLPIEVLALHGDAADPYQLERGGITHPLCKGVIAVIGEDQENLKIAISAKLLNPGLKVVGRVSQQDTADNMRSFGTDHIVNPFLTFARHFSLAFSSPGLHLLNEWLSLTDYQELNEPVFPPRGLWILCGYGRLGKALHKKLKSRGNEVVVIEVDPDAVVAPDNAVKGRGTEAVTLREARVEEAVGIVAGTNNDANNLSIVMTAKEINPKLFTVARQNQNRNAPLFEAAQPGIVFNQNRLIANEIINLLTTPLSNEFLRQANRRDAQWANEIVSRISATVDNFAPLSWVLELMPNTAPAFIQALHLGHSMRLEQICREPTNRKVRLPCVPLMLARGEEFTLAPEDDTMLEIGDRILFCGPRIARDRMLSAVLSNNIVIYLITGRHEIISPVWRRLTRPITKP